MFRRIGSPAGEHKKSDREINFLQDVHLLSRTSSDLWIRGTLPFAAT